MCRGGPVGRVGRKVQTEGADGGVVRNRQPSSFSAAARTSASVRCSTPSLPYRLAMCRLTVAALISSSSAISAFRSPAAINRRISSSRAVIGGAAASEALQKHIEALIFGQEAPQAAMDAATSEVNSALTAAGK